MIRWLIILLFSLPVRAEMPVFETFFEVVGQCRLDLARAGARELLGSDGAVVLALPSAGAPRGVLVTGFYFAAGPADQGDDYGLLFAAPLERVGEVFPELAAPGNVNGHLRRLQRFSDHHRDQRAGNRTLLLCRGGSAA